MKTVTRRDVAKTMSEKLNITIEQAKQSVDIFLQEMGDVIMQKGRIEVRGFASFDVIKVKPKPGARNPRTGELVYVPARRKVRFKPGHRIKEALAQPKGNSNAETK